MPTNRKPKKNPKDNQDLWTYEVDEPQEHEPWLLPQVFVGLRADQIPSLADNEPPLEAIAAIGPQLTESNRTQVMGVWTEETEEPLEESESVPQTSQMVLQLKPIRQLSEDKDREEEYFPIDSFSQQESLEMSPTESLPPISNQMIDYPSYGAHNMPSPAIASDESWITIDDSRTHTFILEYIIYYEKRPHIYRPVAVLIGKFRQQIPYELRESSQFVKNDGIITIELMNDKDIEMIRDYAEVLHSSDRITISPKNHSIAYLFGETCGGITFGSDSVLHIKGILLEYNNGRMNSLGGGRLTVKPNSGALKIVICDKEEIVLMGSNNDYSIDDKSYLSQDIGHQIIGESLTGSRKSIGTQTETSAKVLNPKSILTKSKLSKDLQKKRLTTEITKVEPIKEYSVYGDTHSTTMNYMIYYCTEDPSDPSIIKSEAVAVLTGRIIGQIICHQSFNGLQGNGIMRIELMDMNDKVMVSDMQFIMNNEHSVRIKPTVEEIVYVFGEKIGGFVFGCDSELIAIEKCYLFENGKNKKLIVGVKY